MNVKQNRIYIIIAVICLVLFGIYYVVQQMSGAKEVAIVTASPVSSPSATVLPGIVTVHVTGAVRNPGVYELERGKRVVHAIEMAGGLAENADEASVNMAAVLNDAQQIAVREIGEASSSAGVPNVLEAGGKININTAEKEELMLLSGIGETLAGNIVQYREANGGFQTVDDLIHVPKIGEKTLDNIRAYITVE